MLETYHAEDAREMPHTAPGFHASAALWAARILYYTILLTLVRELDEIVIQEYLTDFAGDSTPEVVYSADLTLRYLPDLLRLAKGLAPGDALVARLQTLGRQWPLSLVGQELPLPESEAQVLAHPSLRQEYVDRIIRIQDRRRAGQDQLRPLVQAALGGHAATLWPDFQAFTLLTTDGKQAS
ncbi:hypothetical protein MUN79_17090 [Hymenobacter cellulosilyticus]|uniref:MoxR-vWA-beta-propeller ternary system domain-containing protein n=1 Tax=Hymenobacter cellulosilyticus TaxID=2932248 RepID=A0A8T9Q5T8_9BACT|nr:hypothetical protein MUN79_17090 [Hymenobacter cellulosilyticus]